MIEVVSKRTDKLIFELLKVWEASVGATHEFLGEDDIEELKPMVSIGLEKIENLVVFKDDVGKVLAFLGVDGDKVEMLFVMPSARGQGVGKTLMEYAVADLGCKLVDVNEQNPQAIGFYEKMGFAVIGRSEFDGQGKPYPILHMQMK